ncbi:MAG: AMP-binding protein [Nitrospina sp.]|nr:AMP-binding protein [Nitrospina sp.]
MVNAGSFQHLPQLFFQQVETLGEKTALRHKDFGIWNCVTWREYGQRVKDVAAGLMTLGLQPGDRVAILGENRPEWLYCHLGVMAAAGTTVGIYPTNAADEIRYVVNHSEARILFAENEEQVDKILEVIDELDCEKIIVWDPKGLWGFSHPRISFFEAFLAPGKESPDACADELSSRLENIKPHDLAMFIYTSGTTGRPKGAMISHRNILHTTDSFTSALPRKNNDELLSYLPLAHIYENLISVFQAISTGATVNFVESMATLAHNLTEVSPTIFASVPRIWEKFASGIEIKMSDSSWLKRICYQTAFKVGLRYVAKKEKKKVPTTLAISYWILYWSVLHHLRRIMGLERIRYALCGAAPASLELFHWYNAMGVKLIEGFGQTESTGVISLSPLEAPRLGYVGKPTPGVETRIAEDGEILVRGENVFRGYFKNETLYRETVDGEGWLHTGDVGAFDDGYLKILDRKKDIIITAGGKNVTPSYIENKLKFSLYIQDSVVIGDRRKYLTALILIDEDNVNKYAQDNRIPYTTFEDLTRNEEINKLIEGEIKEVNKDLARVETIKKFRLLPRRFYQEDGDVTPTQKVKRSSLEKRYTHLIDEMYRG